MWQRRLSSKNVCGIPHTESLLLFLLSLLSLVLALPLSLFPSFVRFRGFFYNTFNLLCSSARSQPCVSFLPALPWPGRSACLPAAASSCVCVCLRVCLFSAVECPIQVLLLLLIVSCSLALSLSVLSVFSLTQRFLRAAALIFAARGHYQLIDYFDCYLIPPHSGSRAHMCM